MEINHYLRIRVLPDKTREAIATEKGLQGWWTKEAIKVDNILRFSFNGEYKTAFKILKDTKNEIQWVCTEGHEDWIGSIITFNLKEEKPNTTILTFTHKDFKENMDKDMLANCNYNWGRFLYSLKIYSETGKGFPVE